jgi:signal transduction histidine kinase
MPLELAELGGSWPVAASLAAAVTARGLATGRRRSALNEALHELRRPLHALALSPRVPAEAGLDSTLGMAVAALERLDREINGEGPGAPARSLLAVRPLVEEAVARSRARAAATGNVLRLRWAADRASLLADPGALGRALDNLLANAIEHGGREVAIGGVCVGDVLRISVSDSGGAQAGPVRGEGRRSLARLSGRCRRGHGLRVVRRVAAEHDGQFDLRISAEGTVATLSLPLADGDG